jgi:hypothetical protein
MHDNRLIAVSPDNRRDLRTTCRSPVTWAYFNRPETHEGWLSDFSSSGAGIESIEALIPGATIMLRIKAYAAGCRPDCGDERHCPWPRSIALAEIKWCRDLSGGRPPRFGAGVRFHPPDWGSR